SQAINKLRPELAIEFLAMLPPQPPRLVKAEIDNLALAIFANGDERLRRLAVGALFGRMLGQDVGLRMDHRHRLVPGQLAEIVPSASIFERVSADLHERIARGVRREVWTKLGSIRRAMHLRG